MFFHAFPPEMYLFQPNLKMILHHNAFMEKALGSCLIIRRTKASKA
tara:strand:- start:4790 stop:4927 length:138 start_codon:yes stop_codon:yes gene_type:complete